MNRYQSTPKRRTGTPGFWALIGLAAIILIVILAILVDSALYYNKVHSGVSVAGVGLGGQTKTEAVATIQEVVDQAQGSPITLTYEDQTWSLMPSDVAAAMDVEGAVAAAMAVTRENNFFTDIGTRWKLYFSDRDLALTGGMDGAKMDAFIAGLAADIDVAPVNAGLSIENGEIKVIESVDGRAVDRESLTLELETLLVSLHNTSVTIPVVVTEPAVKAEDNRAAQQQAETMISGPVNVTHTGKTWSISAEQIASYMGFTAEQRDGVSTLVPRMDVTKLQPLLAEIGPAVASEPVNASFDSDGRKAWVVPGKDGEQLDAEATARAITEATLRTSGRTVEVVTMKKEADLTTQEAEDMGIKDLLSSYTTKYTGSSDRQVNVRITTQYATNLMLAPGEEYNFDKQIGPRTAARGYKPAPGITGPNTLEDVLGGGICQVSTTMFNTVIEAGLKVTERHNHSIYIDHYPKGRDATVTAGGKNLRFKNDTGKYIWIRGSSNGITTTISIYGTDDGRKVQISVGDFYNVTSKTKVTVLDPQLQTGKSTVVESGQVGRALRTKYVVTRGGKVMNEQTFISSWPMYPTRIAIGTATTKPPSTTTTEAAGTTTTKAPTTTTNTSEPAEP